MGCEIHNLLLYILGKLVKGFKINKESLLKIFFFAKKVVPSYQEHKLKEQFKILKL